jgi:hypothetical protein
LKENERKQITPAETCSEANSLQSSLVNGVTLKIYFVQPTFAVYTSLFKRKRLMKSIESAEDGDAIHLTSAAISVFSFISGMYFLLTKTSLAAQTLHLK